MFLVSENGGHRPLLLLSPHLFYATSISPQKHRAHEQKRNAQHEPQSQNNRNPLEARTCGGHESKLVTLGRHVKNISCSEKRGSAALFLDDRMFFERR